MPTPDNKTTKRRTSIRRSPRDIAAGVRSPDLGQPAVVFPPRARAADQLSRWRRAV